MKKTAAMLRWEENAGMPIENMLGKYGTDFSNLKELARELSKYGMRVTEGTAYLWLKRYEYREVS